jgi:hypothetical protein
MNIKYKTLPQWKISVNLQNSIELFGVKAFNSIVKNTYM